jgi:hypothetical protein
MLFQQPILWFNFIWIVRHLNLFYVKALCALFPIGQYHVLNVNNIKGTHLVAASFIQSKVKVKPSRYTPWRRLGGEEI